MEHMPTFPQIKSQAELNHHLVNLKADMKDRRKWLTREMKSVKKDSIFSRLIKKIFNLFPGDRFAKVRANNVAHGMAEFCKHSQHVQWIDNDIALLACAVLDLLQDKIKNAKKRTTYSQEIEKAKKEILALVKKESEKKDFSQTVDISGTSSEIDLFLQDFSKKIATAKEIHITAPLTSAQEKIVKDAINQSTTIEKVVVSPEVFAENKDLVDILNIKGKLEVKTTPSLFEISGPSSKIEMLLHDFSKKIERVKVIYITEPLTPEQEKIVKDAIDQSTTIEKVVVSPNVHAENRALTNILDLRGKLNVTESLQPQPVEISGTSNEIDLLLQDFSKKIENAKEILITDPLTSAQEKIIKNVLDKSSTIKKMKVSPEVSKGNKKFIDSLKLSRKLLVITDSNLSKDHRQFNFINPSSSTVAQGDQVSKLLKKLAEHIEKLEDLDVVAELTSTQEDELVDLIAKASNLQKVTVDFECVLGQGLKGGEGYKLAEAICNKKGLKEVSCPVDDLLFSMLAQNPETLEILHMQPNRLKRDKPILTAEGIQKLVACPQLKTISLSRPHWYINEKDSVVKALAELPHLEKLKLDCDKDFLSFLSDDIEAFPCLSKLELFVSEFSNEALDKLSLKKSKIEEIEIHYTKIDKKKMFESLSRFNLKKFTLANRNLNYEDYRDLEKLNTLEELTIHYPSDGNAVETIERLIKKLPSLKKVTFHPSQGAIRHCYKYATITQGNSLLPHEISKLQKTFEGRDLTIYSVRSEFVDSDNY